MGTVISPTLPNFITLALMIGVILVANKAVMSRLN